MRNFKFYFCSVIAISLFLFISGCDKDDDNGGKDDKDDIVGTPVIITGEINSASTQATKVLAFSCKLSFSLCKTPKDYGKANKPVRFSQEFSA